MTNLLSAADGVAAPPARLPDTFLVGAMKAGTSALAGALAAHPEVFVCPVKEPHALADAACIGPDRAARGVHPARAVMRRGGPAKLHHATVPDAASYAALFAGAAGHRAVVDASTSYLMCPPTPGRIAAARPNARIVVVLREPAERAAAHHRMDRRIGRERRSLTRALAEDGAASPYIRHGRYATALARYQAVFAPEQLLVLWHEELVTAWAATGARLTAHLGVTPRPLPAAEANAGRAPRWPGLTRALYRTGADTALRRALPAPVRALARRALTRAEAPAAPAPAEHAGVWAHLDDEMTRLEALLDRDLSHWR